MEALNEIPTVLQDDKDKTIQQELVDDMMSLLVSFSGKLYGMRSSKNKNKSLFTEKLEEAIDKENKNEKE